MADINKAIKPVESVRIAPLNDGSLYQANREIKFRLGAGLDMFLVNKSYLTFDLKVEKDDFKTALDNSTDAFTLTDSYIRNANNIFRTVEVYYGGDCIYTTKVQNIQQNTLKMLNYGDDYLDANWATYTTTNLVKQGRAHLKISNGARQTGTGATNTTLSRADQTIHNIQIPLNQLIPFWMDVDSNGFPMRSLNQQIEIRLYVADPYLYIVDWDKTIKDFSYNTLAPDPATKAGTSFPTNIKDRFPSNKITLENVYIYANYYTPDANEAAIIDDKCANGSYKLRYNTWEFDERQVDSIKTTNNLPFTVVTSNTKSIVSYCFKKQTSPSVMYRPNINNLQMKFTPHVAPLQPIAGNTMDTPHEYKFQVDDVFNNIDTYFTSTNTDYNQCYQYEASGTAGTAVTKPSSTFVLFGLNYVSDPTDLGADSSDWNSQYQLNFNAAATDDAGGAGLQFVVGVNVENGLIIKENKIFTFTL